MTEEKVVAELLHKWHVPGLNGAEPTQIPAFQGRAVVVVGPNGSGKSALGYWLSRQLPVNVPYVRVHAHRRIWLTSAGSEMTASSRRNHGRDFDYYDSRPNSRVVLQQDGERAHSIIYDLLTHLHVSNQRLRKRVTNPDVVLAGEGSLVDESVLDKTGRVFAEGNFGFGFDLADDGTIVAVGPQNDKLPIDELSDGEKNAFLLAAQTLLAPKGSVILVDEPERHLHRAISSKFIAALVRERPDAAFVLFTHDLDIINKLDPATTEVYIVNAVSWSESEPSGWEIQIAPAEKSELPESVRQAILGGRTKLLLVEGQAASLDMGLYRLAFPDWAVVPCGSAKQVQMAVDGLQGTNDHHWVEALAVMDGDARTDEEAQKLADKKILVLPVNEVESLYYLSCVVDAVAIMQADTFGDDADKISDCAKTRALQSLGEEACRHLAAENAGKILHRKVLEYLPKAKSLKHKGETLDLNLPNPYPAQYQNLRDLLDTQDYDRIVRGYSIRDSPFRDAVAKALKFQNHEDYQNAVLVRLEKDPELLGRVREVIERFSR